MNDRTHHATGPPSDDARWRGRYFTSMLDSQGKSLQKGSASSRGVNGGAPRISTDGLLTTLKPHKRIFVMNECGALQSAARRRVLRLGDSQDARQVETLSSPLAGVDQSLGTVPALARDLSDGVGNLDFAIKGTEPYVAK